MTDRVANQAQKVFSYREEANRLCRTLPFWRWDQQKKLCEFGQRRLTEEFDILMDLCGKVDKAKGD